MLYPESIDIIDDDILSPKVEITLSTDDTESVVKIVLTLHAAMSMSKMIQDTCNYGAQKKNENIN